MRSSDSASDPQRLDRAMDDVLAAWHRENGQQPPIPVWCAEASPLDPATLCRRFDGHSGPHSSDGADAWLDSPNDNDSRRTA